MSKDFNSLNLDLLLKVIKNDSVFQGAIAVSVILAFSLVHYSGSSNQTSSSPTNTAPPPVSAPAPPGAAPAQTPAVPAAPAVVAPAQSQPAAQAPLFGGQAQTKQPQEIKPGQSLDNLGKTEEAQSNSFGRVKSSNKQEKSIEVK